MRSPRPEAAHPEVLLRFGTLPVLPCVPAFHGPAPRLGLRALPWPSARRDSPRHPLSPRNENPRPPRPPASHTRCCRHSTHAPRNAPRTPSPVPAPSSRQHGSLPAHPLLGNPSSPGLRDSHPNPATPTKICTRRASSRPRRRPSPARRRPLTHAALRRGAASAARCSAIHFRDRSIRQVSCYTLPSGCRLLWPPPCCPDTPTPFALCPRIRRHSHASGSSRIASSAYQKWPTRRCHLRALLSPVTPAHSEFEGRPTSAEAVSAGHSLYRTRLPRARCPEGNFRGNQLLDGSIGLSPLCPDATIDLHVRTAAGLHQGFPWLRPPQA